MDKKIKVNCGRVVINNIIIPYCDKIYLKYTNEDGKWVLHFFIRGTISKCDEKTIRQIKGNFEFVTVDLLAGYRMGGIEPTLFNNCKIDSIEIKSEQGEIVVVEYKLSKKVFEEKNKGE